MATCFLEKIKSYAQRLLSNFIIGAVKKHFMLTEHVSRRIPNYFWFVTCDLEIEPPGYAGWVYLMDTGERIMLRVKKPAPRLHREKLTSKHAETIGRLACYRLKNHLVKAQENFVEKE